MSNPPNNIESKADILIQKIKHFLITNLGKLESEATTQEFYRAFCTALREELMINWTANLHTFDKERSRMIYYISMEYLPGKFLGNNITNVGAWDLLKAVLTKTNHNLFELFECESDPGLGNGGLGRLASCFLDSLSTLKYPAMGYGLRYQYGIFDQEIWNGVQIERPDCWLLNENPWEFRKDLHSSSLFFRGTLIPASNSHGDQIFTLEDYEEVRAIPYDYPIIGYSETDDFPVISMRLWTTKESPKNFELQRYNAGQLDQASENSSLTDVLYPNDHHETGKRIRLKQEFLLSCASVQDIIKHHMRIYGDIRSLSDKVQIQLNDTHPVLVIIELIRRLNAEHDLPWKTALEMTQRICNYTNHTILKESLEEWNEQRMATFLPRHYQIIQKLNQEFCEKVRARFPNDENRINRMTILKDGQVRMAHLAIFGCKKVNGVAALHSEILKNELFKDFYELYPDKFINVTNGVTPRRWLLYCNPALAKFIVDRIGMKWITDFTCIQELANFAEDSASQEAFLAVKKKNKERLLYYLAKENPTRNTKGRIISHSYILGPDALFDVHVKRFHEYKRQLLNALHILMLFDEIKANPKSRKAKRMVIVGGKAAPGYEMAKYTILLFCLISKKINLDPVVSEYLRVAVVENYNVSKSETIIPAADISQQISMAGMEASGTGNMKLAMNGALTIGTEDGANIEMRKAVTDYWWPFSFGMTIDEVKKEKLSKTYNPQDICNKYPNIKQAVMKLKDGSLANSDAENQALLKLYDSLFTGSPGDMPDKYFVLKDLPAYYETQKKAEELYSTPNKWAEYAIHNIAGMGKFSSDVSIENYSRLVWDLKPCPPKPEILAKIKEEYSEKRHFTQPSTT